ncbi:MAG: hypothetical protein ACK5OB_10315 [Pirellula sp.]
MAPIGIRSRQRIGIVLLLIFIGLCPGVRPVVHRHSEYGQGFEAAAFLVRHLESFHGQSATAAKELPEGFHLHWMLICQDVADPHCQIQSAVQGHVLGYPANAVSDAVPVSDPQSSRVENISLALASRTGRSGCDSRTASHSMRLVRSAHALYGIARI